MLTGVGPGRYCSGHGRGTGVSLVLWGAGFLRSRLLHAPARPAQGEAEVQGRARVSPGRWGPSPAWSLPGVVYCGRRSTAHPVITAGDAHAGLRPGCPAPRCWPWACGRHYAYFPVGSGGKIPGDPLQLASAGDKQLSLRGDILLLSLPASPPFPLPPVLTDGCPASAVRYSTYVNSATLSHSLATDIRQLWLKLSVCTGVETQRPAWSLHTRALPLLGA